MILAAQKQFRDCTVAVGLSIGIVFLLGFLAVILKLAYILSFGFLAASKLAVT